MLSLSSPTPLAEWELQSQIRRALGEGFSGQIHVSFLNSRTETIFALGGEVKQVYLRNNRTPDLKWEHPLIRFGRGALELTPMPPRAMLFQKVALEEVKPTAPQPSFTNQLRTMFDLTEHNASPTLFHIRWDRAQGFMLAGGKGMFIRHAAMLTPDGIAEGQEALSQMSGWQEARCNVTVRRGNIKSQAWLEVHLNILFEYSCRNILKQYGQLTGGIVVHSILHNVTTLAAKKGWNIAPRDQHLGDATIFASAAEAGSAYREILGCIRALMIPVIGGGLTHNLIRQAKESVRDVYHTIEDAFGLLEDMP
jgi:hypothetical protein